MRPGGFWGIVSKEARNLPGKALNSGTFLDVIGRIMLCYGLSLTIGYSILLKFSKASICFALAILGAVIVRRWFKKEVRILKESKFFSSSQDSSVKPG